MAESKGFDTEAFQKTMLTMMDELSIKQAEHIKEELKEENLKLTESLNDNLENISDKLNKQMERISVLREELKQEI